MLKNRDAFCSSILTAKVRHLGDQAPLGCFLEAFWPPLGHPLERNRDAFSGLVPGRSSGGFGMDFWGALGGDFGWILAVLILLFTVMAYLALSSALRADPHSYDMIRRRNNKSIDT